MSGDYLGGGGISSYFGRKEEVNDSKWVVCDASFVGCGERLVLVALLRKKKKEHVVIFWY